MLLDAKPITAMQGGAQGEIDTLIQLSIPRGRLRRARTGDCDVLVNEMFEEYIVSVGCRDLTHY